MQKLYITLVAVGVSLCSFAQTQRLVLAEEYTRASCIACRQQDSAYQALMNANPTKVVSLTYHVAGTGTDPMNTQTQTTVSPRVTYYGIGTISNCRIDGDTTLLQTPNYTGSPDNLTQSDINTEYAVSAPFSIAVSHTMSNDFDSAFVTVTVTAEQNFNAAGFLKLRLAMVEKHIHFNTAPGLNGQTDFYNVLRGMYPNTTGTAAGNSWNNNQTNTWNFSVALPNYIYDKNEVAFIAWLQDDGNYKVKQAAIDNPVQLPKDAAVTAISGLPTQPCNTTFTPSVTLKNMGSSTLTSCTINYQIDAQTAQTFSWTGSLTSGNTTVVALPSQTVTISGTHTFTAWPSSPNGTTDYNTASDSQSGTFMTVGPAVASPLVEGFTSSTYPPTGWSVTNPDADAVTWVRSTSAGGFQVSNESTMLSFYNSPAGHSDELLSQNVDMTVTGDKTLTFVVAYCQSSTETDTLKVQVSTDCGMSWTTVFLKYGSNLKTKSAQSSSFVPTSSSHWRMEAVDLTPYGSATSLLVKFIGISKYGNNLYLDDINIGSTSIMENNSVNSVSVFPDPLDQHATLDLQLSHAETVTVEIYSMTGELVAVQEAGTLSVGEHQLSIDGSQLANGFYFARVTAGQSAVTQKFAVSH